MYGSAVYICAEDKFGNRSSNLVIAKSRVAPVKRVSLPRLELLAAYITPKLLDYVIQALRIVVDAVYGWSDSQITLPFIRRPSANCKVFVAYRVQDIHQRVAQSQWRFCSGTQNPADLVTRGISVYSEGVFRRKIFFARSEIHCSGPLVSKGIIFVSACSFRLLKCLSLIQCK